MNTLRNLWWRLVERSGLRTGFATEIVDDLPDSLAPARLYLIGDPPRPWSAAMLCPCGCAATIQLSLVAKDKPSWQVRRHFYGSVTLRPSIWRTRGCRSHFHLRHGRIVWSRSAASQPSRTINHGALSMPNLNYPGHIDRLTQGAISQLSDYLSLDIETPNDVAMLEDRALGTAAKVVYFNTIRNQLRAIASGERDPTDCLRHLDTVAQTWMSKGADSRDRGQKGAPMALALSDRWRNWAIGGSLAKERVGFVDHFGLPD